MTRLSAKTESDFISVKPCGQKLYELIPKKKIRLDIVSIATKLEKEGYRIIENSGLVLQIKNEHDVSIYPSGKMLVFPAENGNAATAIGRKIMAIIIDRVNPAAEKGDSRYRHS